MEEKEQVLELRNRGMTIRAIATRLGMQKTKVGRWVKHTPRGHMHLEEKSQESIPQDDLPPSADIKGWFYLGNPEYHNIFLHMDPPLVCPVCGKPCVHWEICGHCGVFLPDCCGDEHPEGFRLWELKLVDKSQEKAR